MEYPNWFEPYARPLFEKYLLPLAGKPDLRFLQVGAYTGDATVWLLERVLGGEGSTLTDVDTWRGSDEPEHQVLDWADVQRVYLSRTQEYKAYGRLLTFVGNSFSYLKSASELFDFVYIDGDHDPMQVLHDGMMAIPLVKPGGLLAFDDYQWTPHGGGPGPGAAVNQLRQSDHRLTTLELSAQAWFQVNP